MPTFSPPTDNVPFAPPLERWHFSRGRSVYRLGGVWHEEVGPFWGTDQATGVRDADIVPTADRPGGERTDYTDRDRYVFLGGHEYMISTAVAATLTAAGYAANIT